MSDVLPGRYRVKDCPKCGQKHKKRGVFCSSACANQRPTTDQANQKRALRLASYHTRRSDESDEAVWRYKGGSEDDIVMPASSVHDQARRLQSGQFISGGAIWDTEEDWWRD